ncbi:hypothetical protein ACFZDG_25700 [Kitasatospora xanthocidica]|uniref:hypothetical protein n=1 Tax=Kitasatospora xanthocidica TaxID=83382 RepID=UPI0036E5B1E0
MTFQPGPVRPDEPPVPPVQPGPDGPPPPQPPPPSSPYATSEATRLLCAGVYLDPDYRRRVITELVDHDERSVPPSLGFDLVTVLAHALRARALEVQTGLILAGIWIGFFLTEYWPLIQNPPGGDYWRSYGEGLTSGYYSGSYGRASAADPVFGDLSHYLTPFAANFAFLYALVGLVSWYAKPAAVRDHALYAPATPPPAPSGQGEDSREEGVRRAAGGLLGAVAVILQLLYWALALLTLKESDGTGVLFPLALAAAVGGHRLRVAQTVRRELTRAAFRSQPVRRLPARARYQALHRAIAEEQYSRLVVYDPADPFLGFGFPFRVWSFTLELRHRKTGPVVPEGTLTARTVLDLVVPRLAALRQAAAETSLDRLKDLEIEHIVFLPYGPARAEVVRTPQEIGRHIAEAVDEGGERRRHFLRVRVGAWDEQLVLTVQLRVHTQGNLLMVEVVPHVLGPVRRDYELLADAVAQQGASPGRRAPAMSAFTAGPAALRSLLHPGGGRVQTGTAEDDLMLVAARPVLSLREAATSSTVSIFQELDVSRYLKSISERIIEGVRVALERTGYETDRFEQTVVQVMQGGIHIGSMSGGAVATNGGTAQSGATPAPPPTGGTP